MRQQDLQSSSVNIPCGRGTFRQLSLTFRVSARSSVTFPCNRGSFVNFHQFSVHPQYLLSGSVYFVNPRDHESTFRPPMGPSVKCSYVCGSFCEFPSTYIRGTSIILRQLFVHQRDIQSTFRASLGLSVNFRKLSVHPRDHASNFHVSVVRSVIFSTHSVQP